MIFEECCDGEAHATTQLAAAALRLVCAGASVLDVGTGDGTLAMIAVGCGAAQVVAIDHDPAASGVVRPSAGVAAHVADILMSPPRERFDVVVANLPEDVALAALPALASCTRGTLIVTGGRWPRAATFARHLRALGLAAGPPTARDGWFCFMAHVTA